MIFLEYVGSRACLSARSIKLSPVKLRFYGTFLLCQCENRFDRFILAETDAFFFLCVINCNDIVIGLLEVAYDIRNNFFLKCCFFYPL